MLPQNMRVRGKADEEFCSYVAFLLLRLLRMVCEEQVFNLYITRYLKRSQTNSGWMLMAGPEAAAVAGK